MSDIIIWILVAVILLIVLYAASARFRQSKLGRNVGKHVDKDDDGRPFR